MDLNAKQSADYANLRSYYPYRLFFLVQEKGESDFTVWAMRDRREINRVLREGGTVFQIEK